MTFVASNRLYIFRCERICLFSSRGRAAIGRHRVPAVFGRSPIAQFLPSRFPSGPAHERYALERAHELNSKNSGTCGRHLPRYRVAAIGGFLLYGPILNSADYIVGAGADSRVFLGALLELILAGGLHRNRCHPVPHRQKAE